MPSAPVVVYDQNMRKVGYLENAANIGYETPLNGLWQASFSLPADDPKNVESLPLRYVQSCDGEERVELFRILPTTTQRSADGKVVTYRCEHVLATLLDDVLFQYHQVGGAGMPTANVLSYILARQTVQRWQLGTVQFVHEFEYSWENETLLAALQSVPKPFAGEWMWTWDTSVYPWRLNLIVPPVEEAARIRYGVNLRGITKEVDPSNLCTRLYCLGYGEGINQLTIAEVNGGKPYLDADTQAQYGVITRIFVDRSIEDPGTLKARGEALLNEMKHPRISYTVDAAELYNITRDPLDKFRVGSLVRVTDHELGIDIRARAGNVRENNLLGGPGDVQLEIANRVQDLAGSLADLNERQRINEVHAQGATNVDTQTLVDNCDQSNPAILRFYIPPEAVRVNKVLLTYRTEAFRAYSRATKGGGAYSDTTEAGGGRWVTALKGNTKAVTGDGTYVDVETLISSGMTVIGGPLSGWILPGGEDDHTHRIYDHRHHITHEHEIEIPDHRHSFEIPDHTHDIDYGIYEGPTPTVITVQVDG